MSDRVRMWIDQDEWWPVYSLNESTYTPRLDVEVDLSVSELAEYRAAMSAFKDWQDRLEAMYHQGTEPT